MQYGLFFSFLIFPLLFHSPKERKYKKLEKYVTVNLFNYKEIVPTIICLYNFFFFRNQQLSEVKVKRQMSIMRREQKIVNLESKYVMFEKAVWRSVFLTV